MKINFDAAVFDNRLAAAFVIRDHNGKIIRAGGRLLTISSIPYVELIATWLGIKLAIIELQASHIWVERDSLIIIKWITKPSSCKGYPSPLLHDIQVRIHGSKGSMLKF